MSTAPDKLFSVIALPLPRAGDECPAILASSSSCRPGAGVPCARGAATWNLGLWLLSRQYHIRGGGAAPWLLAVPTLSGCRRRVQVTRLPRASASGSASARSVIGVRSLGRPRRACRRHSACISSLLPAASGRGPSSSSVCTRLTSARTSRRTALELDDRPAGWPAGRVRPVGAHRATGPGSPPPSISSHAARIASHRAAGRCC